MKKILCLVATVVLVLFCAGAQSITYVYGNSISSLDFETLPRRGQIFVDEGMNVLAVKAIREDVVVFDKLISRTDYERGSVLTERNALNSLSIIGSLNHSLVGYGITTPLYPLSALVLAGASYGNALGFNALALVGGKVNVCLANLWDTGNTFIENGKLSGWAAAGIGVGSSVTFACCYGFSYRHNLDSFCWEVGVDGLSLVGIGTEWSPYIGLGVDF